MAQVCCRSAIARARCSPRCESPKATAAAVKSTASRRAILTTITGTSMVALGVPGVWALNSISLTDNRDARVPLESMDRMRDESNSYKGDRHFFQGEVATLTEADHKKRLAEAKDRLNEVKGFIEAKQWNRAAQEIGQGLGTARFDMDNLTAKVADKANRNRLNKLQDVAMRDVETLFVDLKRQDVARASASFEKAKNTFSQAVSAF